MGLKCRPTVFCLVHNYDISKVDHESQVFKSSDQKLHLQHFNHEYRTTTYATHNSNNPCVQCTVLMSSVTDSILLRHLSTDLGIVVYEYF